jgi:hypothetical protein
MRRPSRGVLIRLFIYGPIIGYLAWRAFASDPTPSPDADPAQPDATRRTFTTPDGKSMEVLEVTPEQAEAILGRPLPASDQESEPDENPPAG